LASNPPTTGVTDFFWRPIRSATPHWLGSATSPPQGLFFQFQFLKPTLPLLGPGPVALWPSFAFPVCFCVLNPP
jgi:hypothetical protein